MVFAHGMAVSAISNANNYVLRQLYFMNFHVTRVDIGSERFLQYQIDDWHATNISIIILYFTQNPAVTHECIFCGIFLNLNCETQT